MINETGKIYGRLTVLRKVITTGKPPKTRWLCQCSCGNKVVVVGGNLRNDSTRSCGCLRSELNSKRKTVDEVGSRFGLLTIIKRAGTNKDGKAMWLCQCDCGRKKIIAGIPLRIGTVKSCGCLKTLPRGKASFNVLYYQYQHSANKRGLVWNITKDEFRRFTKSPCYYCGIRPNQVKKGKNGNYVYNGLDRYDSEKGYTIDNIVPCCWLCNSRKGALSPDIFFQWITDVYNNCFSKKSGRIVNKE